MTNAAADPGFGDGTMAGRRAQELSGDGPLDIA
jgi:hypothetical protein